MKKKKNKRNRKILLLILLLFMTGVCLSTSTYAWFTANKTVSIGSINVNVEAQGGIQISADGQQWKAMVLTTDLTSVHNTSYTTSVNQIPNTLEPVSTGGNINADGKMEMFYGEVTSNDSGDFILTSTKSVETESNGATSTGKFVAFDLFFRVEQDTPVFITTNSGVKTTDAVDTGIKNASRFGFVVLGNTAVGSSTSTIQGLNAGTSAPKYIWEPNYDAHTDAAIAHAHNTYGITVDNTKPVPYHGIVAEFDAATNVKWGEADKDHYSTLFEPVTPNYTTIDGFSEYQPIFTLSKGITKVRIYMWVEGQDIDCENDASGGTITFDLQISQNAAA